jgi:hypothetical protein
VPDGDSADEGLPETVPLADEEVDADDVAVGGADFDDVAVTDRVTLGVTVGVGEGACHCTKPAELTGSSSPMLMLLP